MCCGLPWKVGMQRVRLRRGVGGGRADRVDLEVSAGAMWSGHGGMEGG